MLPITGVRLLSSVEVTTDITEAESLAWERENVDIYSCSWGPSDNGDVVAGPGTATFMTLRDGAMEVSSAGSCVCTRVRLHLPPLIPLTLYKLSTNDGILIHFF